MPQMIPLAFAYSGDISVVPNIDAAGGVNYTDGYTPFYELDLSQNNPQARAVERKYLNYLFNILTDNQLFGQTHGYAPWFADMEGGYSANAMVIKQVGSEWVIYRSLVGSNTSDPATSRANWEIQATQASIIAQIPMPMGNGSTAGVVTVATDFNQLYNGTFIFSTDAVASASNGAPAGSLTLKGRLQAITWTVASVTYSVQSYLDSSGIYYNRSYDSSTGWTSWQKMTTDLIVQSGAVSFALDTGSANAKTITLSPIPVSIPEGMEVNFKNLTTNNGSATANVNGSGNWTIYNFNGHQLSGGELVAGGYATMRKLASNAWQLVSVIAPAGFAGISPSQIAMEISQFLMPIGAPIPYPSATAIPSGFIAMSGQAISQSTDPVLFSLYGSNITDLRGEFIRGFDNGKGVDVGRTILSNQSSMNLSHSHTGATDVAGSHNHGASADAQGNHRHGVSGNTDNQGNHSHSASTGAAGNHSHTFNLSSNREGTGWADGASTAAPDGLQTTNLAGNHVHDITVNVAGLHSHGFYADTDIQGLHSHNITVNNAGVHSHTFTTATAGGVESRPRNVAFIYICRRG